MCGLVGFAGPGNRGDIVSMTRALAHRGPDSEGFHIDESSPVFLGHRRLAIRDVEGGHQPMWNADGTVCVVYNGEIYNHTELRAELKALGHRFVSSHSDTEVLVHGYAEWGTGLAARLNGMFAFAVLDVAGHRLYLARDRFGEKPLYYFAKGDLFVFASELQSLALHPQVPREVSRQALQKLFGYGYIPAPHSFLKGSFKLPAAHHMVVDLDRPVPKVERYWRFTLEPDDSLTARSDGDVAEELRELLFQSVKRRMVSDMPLGVFLSGGIDSSAILAAAGVLGDAGRLLSFTIGFNEKSYDESQYAKAVANHVGSKHMLDMLSIDDAARLIPDVLGRLGDPSIVPTYLLSRFSRQHVTVALSGDGGDELFAGYDPFAALGPSCLYSRVVPKQLHRLLRGAVQLLPQSGRNMSLDFKLRRTLMGLSHPEPLWAPVWMAPLEVGEIASLLHEPLDVRDLYSEALDIWETGASSNRVDRLLQYFTELYLQDDILTKVDRASMMCSLETRAIFLDNDVAAFCERLPNQFKFRRGTRKYILKKALEPLLPHDILHRRKKGFGIPLADWMKTVPDEVPLAPISGLDASWASKAWSDHRNCHADQRLFCWNWLSVQHSARHLARAQSER